MENCRAYCFYGLIMLVVFPIHASILAHQNPSISEKSYGLGDMNVSWTIANKHMQIKVSAPTKGWIAVGFNHPGHGLTNSRLFMAAITSDGVTILEEHVADPPNHAKVRSASDSSGIHVQQFQQSNGITELQFIIPCRPTDGSQIVLRSGNQVELILAFSVSTDFQHHSRFRQHKLITL